MRAISPGDELLVATGADELARRSGTGRLDPVGVAAENGPGRVVVVDERPAQDRPLDEPSRKRPPGRVVRVERADSLVFVARPLDERRADALAAPVGHDQPVRHPASAPAALAETGLELDQPEHR